MKRRARKKCIGRSGAFAYVSAIAQPVTPQAPSVQFAASFQAKDMLWGLREVSVALGPPPQHRQGLLALLSSVGHCLCSFFLHLWLLVAVALLRLLARPLRADRAPLGHTCLLLSLGLPEGFLCPLRAIGSMCCHLPTRPQHSRRRARTRAKGQAVHSSGCRWFSPWCLCLLNTPTCIWAAPKPWGEAVDILITAALLAPEPLPGSATPRDASIPQPEDGIYVLSGPLTDGTSPLTQQLMDCADILPEPEARVAHTSEVVATCMVLKPHYHTETLRFRIRLPCPVEAFLQASTRAIRNVPTGYSQTLVPVVPQLAPDHGALVMVPTWVSSASRCVVVYDMRALEGPVYADIVYDVLRYGDCLREAQRHNLVDWEVFVFGHTTALAPSATCVAVPGGVLQFRPRGQPPEWCSALASRMDRPLLWSLHPVLQPRGRDRPLFVTYHERHALYSRRRFPGQDIRTVVAGFVDRRPDTAVFCAPTGASLEDVNHHGVQCRDVLAVFPLSPSPSRAGILVFLDARPVNLPVTHVYLADTRVEAAFLVRYLNLQAPSAFEVVCSPRPQEDDHLHLNEGDVVVFCPGCLCPLG